MTRKTRTPTSTVKVNGHSAEWLKKGFQWVYPNEITGLPARLEPGMKVQIEDKNGQHHGWGIYDSGWISVRRFTSTQKQQITPDFIKERIKAALTLREALLPPETTAWRLINNENDMLPGVRIDVWGEAASLRLDSPSLKVLIDPICDALEELLKIKTIYQGWRVDPRDSFDLPNNESKLVRGPAVDELTVSERGLLYRVRPWAAADAGLYPDMRDNRAWLEPHCAGRDVLNLFAYTGAFSVVAASRGATSTLTTDLSQSTLDRAKVNFELNGLLNDEHEFVSGDNFKVLDMLRRKSRMFDLIVADPPAFSRSDAAFSVSKDYAKLVTYALRVLRPGGLLAMATNQGTFKPRAFQEAIMKGARKAKRPLQLIHSGTQAPDFPSALEFPEGRYLKFGVYRRF